MSESMFNEKQPAENKDSLFSVGDRNYDAEAARVKIENDNAFIDTLKSEKQSMAEQLEALKRQNAELAAKASRVDNLDEALSMVDRQHTQSAATPAIDVEAIKAQLLKESQSLTMNTVAQIEKQRLEAANLQTSIEAAKKIYGVDFGDKLKARGAELGMDSASIDAMAKSNPKMFTELFVPKNDSTSIPTPNGTYSQAAQGKKALGDMLPDWKKPEYWGTRSKAESMMSLEKEVSKMLSEGKLDPSDLNFF